MRAKNGILDVAIIERSVISPIAICVMNLPLSLIGALGNGKKFQVTFEHKLQNRTRSSVQDGLILHCIISEK